MTWKTGFPHSSLLRPVFERGGYRVLGGDFLTSRGGAIFLERFTRPPKRRDLGRGYDPDGYTGYWEYGEPPDAWMVLPEPYRTEGET